MPGYRQVRIGLPHLARVADLLDAHRPDVVYLASPFVLGHWAAKAAESAGIPAVAVYQTDVAGFARRYHLGMATGLVWRRLRAIHRRAALTLAPSQAALRSLAERGIPRLALWQRGVDADRFHPCRRDEAWRRRLAPGGEVLVGYLGRLAPEKQLADLVSVSALPGVRLVLIGDGPERRRLASALPSAAFLGFLQGEELSRAVASLDVAVHPGEHETFGQAVQEALASGVPVVAVGAGGPLDLVRPGLNGLLYPPGDLDALRASVAAVAFDTRLRTELAAGARPSVVARTWEALGDDLLGHLHSVHPPHSPLRQAA